MRTCLFAILLVFMSAVAEEGKEPLIAKEPQFGAITGYFSTQTRFFHTPTDVPQGKTVVLLHGWGVRAHSMKRLADALAKEEYDAFNYDYPSSKWTIAKQTELFLGTCRKLLAQLPPEEKIYFVAHSMGCLILRAAMAQMSEAECHRIAAVVLMGPPNKGSLLAYFGRLPGVKQMNASLGEMVPAEDNFANNIPKPLWIPPILVIAGKYDGKVRVESTHLPAEIPYKHVILPCTHPGLRNPKNTLSQILDFFSE